jgi:hypothetical protein
LLIMAAAWAWALRQTGDSLKLIGTRAELLGSALFLVSRETT